jgi:spore coat polysaccharide biosynthesis protein SpsF
MRVVALIQARMGSTRLPGKTLADIEGEPLLGHVVERVRSIPHVDRVVVVTSDLPGDDTIEALAADRGWHCFRGSSDDVLDRFYRAAAGVGAENVLRITADCPFVCVSETGRLIEHHLRSGADYSHNLTVWGSGMPLGTGSEIFTFASLEASWRDGKLAHHREHVDEYVYEHPERFRIDFLRAPSALHRPELRLTVDTAEDLEFTRQVYARLHLPGEVIPLGAVIELLDENPHLRDINAHVAQKRL